ncbi:MAG TPA: hypothetical protein VII69_07865 [Candidatus Eremiobacteraceae bacterium]
MNQSKLHLGAVAIAIAALWAAGCGSTSGGGGSIMPQGGSLAGMTQGGTVHQLHGTHPLTIAQMHVLTLQDNSSPQVPSFTWTQMAPFVDWTSVQPGSNAAAKAAGIKTMLYTDPNRVFAPMPEYSNDETEYAHDCNNSRITIKNSKTPTYLTQPTSTVLLGLWQAHVAFYNQIGNAQYDAVFEDTPIVRNVSAQPCGYLQSAWLANQNSMNTGLGYPIIFNGLANLANGSNQMSPAMALLPTSIGGDMEGCYSNAAGAALPDLKVWHTFENTEIQVLAAGKLFICRGFDNTPDTAAQVQRLYMYGSFLLTYDPALAIISPKFKPASNGFYVQPEDQLVALDPIITQPSSIDSLNQGTNVYARQYASCYYAGQSIGACATVVNSDRPTTPHPMPFAGVYQHTLVLSGGDILDGGTASTVGPAPATTIAGSTAIIEIQ